MVVFTIRFRTVLRRGLGGWCFAGSAPLRGAAEFWLVFTTRFRKGGGSKVSAKSGCGVAQALPPYGKRQNPDIYYLFWFSQVVQARSRPRLISVA